MGYLQSYQVGIPLEHSELPLWYHLLKSIMFIFFQPRVDVFVFNPELTFLSSFDPELIIFSPLNPELMVILSLSHSLRVDGHLLFNPELMFVFCSTQS